MALRLIALPAFVALFFFSYGLGLDATFSLIDFAALKAWLKAHGWAPDIARSTVIVVMLLPHLLVMGLITAVFGHAAGWLYRRQAVWVAALALLPVLWLRLSEGGDYGLTAQAVAMFENVTMVPMLCLGALICSRRYAAAKPA